jgi:hypothetical protein
MIKNDKVNYYVLPLYGGYISVKKTSDKKKIFFFKKENIYKMYD